MKQSKQTAGVWLDNQLALIIANQPDVNNGEYAVCNKITGKVNTSTGSEHSMHNAQKSQTLKYFKTISDLLVGYDEILLFGPGMSQEQFRNHLKDDLAFRSKQITVETADQLTDPQMIARVRDFFG